MPRTAYATRLSDEELAEQAKDMSPAEREEFRLENATNPLFDMWLRFEDAFTDRAIDRLALSDEDAEAAAKHMEGYGPAASAFAYLLRCVPQRRLLRRAVARLPGRQARKTPVTTPDCALLAALGDKLKEMAQECLDEAARLAAPEPWILHESASRGGPSAADLLTRGEIEADRERLVGRIYHGIARAINEVCKTGASANEGQDA